MIGDRLKTQNNGATWRDCNNRGRRHLWRLDQNLPEGRRGWRCARCPVRTITADGIPRPILHRPEYSPDLPR